MPTSIESNVEKVVEKVRKEFGDKADLFRHIVLPMDAVDGEEFEATKTAGVYLFIHDEWDYIRVGKSFSNASKRALQHCGSDNTTSPDKTIKMWELRHCDKMHMLIFALQKPESTHWLSALEQYLENTLELKIPPKRKG